MTKSIKRFIVPAVLAVGIFIAIYYLFDPENHPFPQCVFYKLTGWECAGCGSQRMFHALLHGDIASAWHFNAAILIATPILTAMAVAGAFRRQMPRFYNVMYSKWVIWSVVGGLMAWWILRNIF